MLQGLAKAKSTGLLDIKSFDIADFETYEKVENGDSTWILPGTASATLAINFPLPFVAMAAADAFPITCRQAPGVFGPGSSRHCVLRLQNEGARGLLEVLQAEGGHCRRAPQQAGESQVSCHTWDF